MTLQSDPEYTSGLYILQDKASCFPATILQPPKVEGAVVIDATAAPGNKTSHLSALMDNTGTVSGFATRNILNALSDAHVDFRFRA